MTVEELRKKAKYIRQQVLEMIVSAGKGHIGGSLSCVDILVALYYGGILRFDANKPHWDERDRFILSKGHACAALYAILADLGFFPLEELASFNREGSMLEGHPHWGIPGIEADTGSLGHGLGIGAGIALAAKMDKKNYLTFVLLSDGECHEGSTWEAAMFASHHKLGNLIAIVDYNKQCSTDYLKDCVNLHPLDDKWEAFGWEVRLAEGHCFQSLMTVLNTLRMPYEKPLVIIACTIKGKGIPFMESKIEWHHRVPSEVEYKKAREELE